MVLYDGSLAAGGGTIL
ncbi:hypothetical protein [Dorea acetigenes]|nr:hypothetical protein [Dorea acetigenes]